MRSGRGLYQPRCERQPLDGTLKSSLTAHAILIDHRAAPRTRPDPRRLEPPMPCASRRPPLTALVLLACLPALLAAAPASPSRPRVVLETVCGDIVLELHPEDAPQTVANFTKLVKQGFYDSLTFHRVVPGFVIQ